MDPPPMFCPETQTKKCGKIEISKNIIYFYFYLLIPPLYFSFAEAHRDLKRDFMVAENKFNARTVGELFKRSFLWKLK